MSTVSAPFGQDTRCRPTLEDVRVLELGHFVAAPFCTRLLGDLGADVIKIEPPGGDPVRRWGEAVDGNSLWWSIHGRNKRSVVLDLKRAAARDIVLRLVEHCDVLVENFRPGHLATLGLGPEVLRSKNAALVIAQISGYGQDGPYRDRAAFGVIGEAIGGLRYLTNHPPGAIDRPPVRVGVSIGDSIAGLYAAFGIMAALWQRDRIGGDGRARTLDVALTESVFSMMEAMLPEYGKLGKIKQPTGGGIATAAPSNAYPTADGQWILIAANSEPLFARLASVIGCPELAVDPRFVDNPGRVRHSAELDRLIGEWTSKLASPAIVDLLEEKDIPASKVYTAEDCAADAQYRHRGMVREVEDPLFGTVLHTGVVPHVPESPGRVRWTGPRIGQHTQEVLGEILGMSADEIAALRHAGATA
jgi:crotonobetainyl-CoA:carnitine CoA-transferase CaiB-like acyl-CoA transferase